MHSSLASNSQFTFLSGEVADSLFIKPCGFSAAKLFYWLSHRVALTQAICFVFPNNINDIPYEYIFCQLLRITSIAKPDSWMKQSFESALFKELFNKSVWIFPIAQSHTESSGVLSHSVKHWHGILLGSTPAACEQLCNAGEDILWLKQNAKTVKKCHGISITIVIPWYSEYHVYGTRIW